MVKYEDLQRQLLEAKSQAEQADEEEELARAAAAVARLTAPDEPMSSLDDAIIAGRWGLLGAATQSRGGMGSEAAQATGVAAVAGRGSRVSGQAASFNKTLSGSGSGSDTEAPHEKVRALEEKMNEVLEHVNLGDSIDAQEEAAGEADGLSADAFGKSRRSS